MSDLTLDVGLAAKLKVAFARNGWTEQLIDAACEGDKLGQFKQVLLGHAAINVLEHVIDCDADPFNPWAGDGCTMEEDQKGSSFKCDADPFNPLSKDGWKVEEHQKGSSFKWDAAQVAFHLSSGQKGEQYIEGNKLRKELADKGIPVLNANVLDYLLANPHLIPEEWKKDGKGNTRHIFFWGTIYRHRGGDLYVRCLYWSDGRWDWSSDWLGGDWGGYDPAAVRAS